MGADVNANIGKLDNLQSREFQSTLGPYGFSKQNAKGEGLLTIYLAHRLQVINTSLNAKLMDRDMAHGLAIDPPPQACLTPT